MLRRDGKYVVQPTQLTKSIAYPRWGFTNRANNNIRTTINQRLPGSRQHLVTNAQPGMVILLIKLFHQRQQALKRKRGIDTESDLAFPAVFHIASLLLQILRGAQ
ncbi:hypothetical protein D3C71_1705510 [compost metagenome]